MPPIIDIQNLSHAYTPDRPALSSLSLSINEGELFAFLGPNGSGKTTLFRILSTLVPPQSGVVSILGLQLPAHQEQVRSAIAVVFQSPALDKQLTARENLHHHAHLYGLRGPDLRRRADDLLARFHLADRAGDLVKTFSGGMQRRVEIAKALLTRPRILLMDEPSTGLDPAARLALFQSLAEVRAADRVTILLTTHLMDDADRADRLAILHQGRLVASGTPTELKDRIGGDVITLTTSDPPRLRDTLASRFPDLPVKQFDDTLRLERDRAHEFTPTLVESLPPGLIRSLSISKPTLEDVFLHSTGHPFRNDPP